MTEAELLAKIESSPVLQRASDQLFADVSFRAGKSARFAIITILMIISIVVQIVALCQKRHNRDRIVDWMKNARTLPRLRTIRLRRRLDALWAEHCDGSAEDCKNNAFFAAITDMGESATDDEIDEILRLAEEFQAGK